jgi:hypothetical protein
LKPAGTLIWPTKGYQQHNAAKPDEGGDAAKRTSTGVAQDWTVAAHSAFVGFGVPVRRAPTFSPTIKPMSIRCTSAQPMGGGPTAA